MEGNAVKDAASVIIDEPSPSLSPGQRLNQYLVVRRIGHGGMGEVYLARDTRLGREVAIKILPSLFARDPGRLRRFEQEARATSALNHPNILTVYDIGTHIDSPYVVSELLEGETLREAIGATALSQARAVDHALQITRGLAAAHEKGIVHRDLKPENLFITRDGRVKILDFGLAKISPLHPGVTQTETPTASFDTQTESGLILGTAGYMSPEQVRGEKVDHRSDIFSFGAVLYEMLSGKRAFDRETMAETMAAILKEEPEELSAINPRISPQLEKIVRRCLEKSPARRFYSAHDLGFAIEEFSDISGSTKGVAPLTARTGKRRYIPVVVSLVLLLVGIASGLLIAGRRGPSTPPSFQRLTFGRGFIPAARFAPDGQTVVYSAEWDGKPPELYETSAESTESRRLGIPNADLLAISTTGEMAISLAPQLGIHSYFRMGTLARVPLTGGTPRQVLEGVSYADWSPDGKNLAVVRVLDGRYHLEFPIGHELYEAGLILSPRVSPQGNLVAFFEYTTTQDFVTVNFIDLAGKKTTLSRGWGDWDFLAWLPEGDGLLFGASQTGTLSAIYAVDLAGRQRLVLPAPGTVEVRDISRSGRILLTRVDIRDVTIGVPPGEQTERNLSWLDGDRASDLSADGKKLLIGMFAEAGKATHAVYLRKTDGSPAVRLGEGDAMSLSADGKWALATLRGTPLQLLALPTGAGEVKRFKVDRFEKINWANWFHDGNRILLSATEAGHGFRLYILDVASSEANPITPEGVQLDGYSNALSPDGQQIAAVGSDGRLALYPVGEGKPKPIPGIEPGERMSGWNADGRSLYVYRRGELPVQVFRIEVATGHRELWKKLMPSDPAGVGTIEALHVTPDGRSYCYTYAQTLSELYLVDGLKYDSGLLSH